MKVRLRLLLGSAIGGGGLLAPLVAAAAPAATAPSAMSFRIAAQPLRLALRDFSLQSGIAIFADEDKVAGKASPGFTAIADPETAIRALLAGSGLVYQRRGSTIVIRTATIAAAAPPPQEEAVPGDIVVTARKREESIQDVPVAITAVTQAELTTRQVTGGPDLITQVPNMTFTKTNFSGYSIQIRGIGTQAISVTTDPAVSVAFNNTPFIRNRFFEQEFYDLDRIEVLRGPQGTLYGRNATAGVVNLISAKPGWEPAAKASVDLGSYKQARFEGMVNLPLLEDKLALRVAGAFTKRDGYVYNSISDSQIDGRNLWSTRTSLRLKPTDTFEANIVWEHFQENDDRLRSGKQLCATDEKTEIAGFPVDHYYVPPSGDSITQLFSGAQGTFSQGCKAESLYSNTSFGTPEGISLPYYLPLGVIGLPVALSDPYVSRTQSRDLRTIESTVKPNYRARSNIYELQLGWSVSDTLNLTSETGYNRDFYFSQEDFNRFNTGRGAFVQIDPALPSFRPGVLIPQDYAVPDPSLAAFPDQQAAAPKVPTAIFCDSQIGCSDRLVGIDVSTARTKQFSQELRLTSDSKGRFNFSVGANYLHYSTDERYYVFFNSLGLIAARPQFNIVGDLSSYVPGKTDNTDCLLFGQRPPNPRGSYPVAACTYIDPNPVNSLNGRGHNYFLSNNPYKLNSYAVFGEGYYELTDRLRLTAGARLTIDKKAAPRIPSWVLGSGAVGYSTEEVVRQRWIEPTGKISLDWKPDLAFTDTTLLYGSLARGYKAGGTNPPSSGQIYYGFDNSTAAEALTRQSATNPKTFKPEYNNAFEVGIKNELFNRTLTVNLAGFYYDYKGYQISQIVDRSASNLNFDATIWGAELETAWSPTRNLQLGLKLGYQRTRLKDGSQAIDLMDRTAGDPNWTLVRPFPTFPSNCILPTNLFQGILPDKFGEGGLLGPNGQILPGDPLLINLGGKGGGNPGPCEIAYQFGNDPVTDAPYVPNPTTGGLRSQLDFKPGYAGFDPSTAPNGGEGIYKDLSGNQLPNAPHITASVTADYSLPLGGDWIATLHGDFYYQGKQWARIFNTPGYDRLRGYASVNFALVLNNQPMGWSILAYVKNAFDKTAITGAFLNSDDTNLTTNIFLTEPRRYGIRFTKDFSGLPFDLGAASDDPHAFNRPYAVTVEGGVELTRRDAAVTPFELVRFPDDLAASAALQRRRVGSRRDSTDLKLTVAPADSPWNATARIRYGKIGSLSRNRAEDADRVCAYYATCDRSLRYGAVDIVRFQDAEDAAEEKHLILDFTVGHDLGLGDRTRASIALGVRHAHFTSNDDLHTDGNPDIAVEDGFFFTGFTPFHRYVADTTVRRSFKGIGPTFNWDASYRLVGGPATGTVAFDSAIDGGLLFGRRRARISSVGAVQEFTNATANFNLPNSAFLALGFYFPPTTTAPLAASSYRSNTATVPTLGGSAGLSYTLGRVAVKAGYRWQRYFNAIDGGDASGARSYDRSIHGPYLKLALGFGR